MILVLAIDIYSNSQAFPAFSKDLEVLHFASETPSVVHSAKRQKYNDKRLDLLQKLAGYLNMRLG